MDWDEARPKFVTITVGEPLATLSVAEIEARIEAHQAEITRLEAELAGKRARSDAASALFRD